MALLVIDDLLSISEIAEMEGRSKQSVKMDVIAGCYGLRDENPAAAKIVEFSRITGIGIIGAVSRYLSQVIGLRRKS